MCGSVLGRTQSLGLLRSTEQEAREDAKLCLTNSTHNIPYKAASLIMCKLILFFQ